LAISGPKAHFRAVIGSARGVYFDTSPLWPFGRGREIYPVRIELTNIQDINQDWFNGPKGDLWRVPLQDVYFSKRSLYVLPPQSFKYPHVNQTTVFGTAPHSSGVPPTSVSDFISLEDGTAQAFSQFGFKIEQLGHKRPLERVPDGIGMLQRSLANYAKTLNASPYFVVWDCKYDCGPNGLKAADERAIKEYIETYAPTRKAEADAGVFWFLIVARDKAVADKVYSGVSQWTWVGECHRLGLRGLRVISLSTLLGLVKTRQSVVDTDDFLLSLLPREFAKPYLG
jgi:hypothetical protein